jgi:hypothetical protein
VEFELCECDFSVIKTAVHSNLPQYVLLLINTMSKKLGLNCQTENVGEYTAVCFWAKYCFLLLSLFIQYQVHVCVVIVCVIAKYMANPEISVFWHWTEYMATQRFPSFGTEPNTWQHRDFRSFLALKRWQTRKFPSFGTAPNTRQQRDFCLLAPKVLRWYGLKN